ncbi:MAG: sensor histidine kinase [Chitinophagaceae bacterium]
MSTFGRMRAGLLKNQIFIRAGLALLLVMLLSFHAGAQTDSSAGCIDIGRVVLSQEIRNSIQTAYLSKNDIAEEVYSTTPFKQGVIHSGNIPVHYVTRKALVRFTVCNSADSITGIYFFPGFYFRNIRLYREEGSGLAALPDIRPSNKESAGYRYFSVPAHTRMVVVAELGFLKTYINKIRPRLINPAYLDGFRERMHDISEDSDLVTYVFCGLMLMMILYSLSVYFQGANKEFLYYSGYALFTGLLLFGKAFYNYHTHPVNFFLEEYLDFMLQCTGILFYLIFMKKFLNTRDEFPFLQKFYNTGILLLMGSMVSYTSLHYGTDLFAAENMVENGTKFFLLIMILIFLVYSAGNWKHRLLRYLFWGNLSYLLFSILSFGLILAPNLFPFRGLAADSILYYELGILFELVFFLAGLNYKNNRRLIEQTRERETLRAQNLLKEYEKEMAVYKAQQEERERISADMHDELGSGMTAIRLMSEIARNKMKENTPAEIEKISLSADDVLNKMNAIIWSMNSSNDTLDNLVSYIRAWSLEYFENTPVACQVHTPEQISEQEILGDKRRNIFLCLKESLNNILKHAEATQVSIDIETGDFLVIRITDNGKGIDLGNLRQFGNGLKNIARRMESIGGHFEIKNDNGTVTTLTLPL